jgi:hypothetical protein
MVRRTQRGRHQARATLGRAAHLHVCAKSRRVSGLAERSLAGYSCGVATSSAGSPAAFERRLPRTRGT